MGINYEALTMPQYFERFGTQEACLDHICQVRWPRGFVCQYCGHNDGYRLSNRPVFQCCVCRRQTSITAGTIFEKTKIPLPTWFLIVYLMSQDKGGTSALRIANQLGMHYDTVWHIMHKIRLAMADREDRLTLAGYIEMDEAFFGGKRPQRRKGKSPLENKNTVFVMVESEGHQAGNIVARVVEDATMETIGPIVAEKVDADPPFSLFQSDGWQCHVAVRAHGHKVKLQKTFYHPTTIDPLRCVHLAIQHIREVFKGTYHHFCKQYMQRYIDEFCFRWNRRDKWTQIPSRLLAACVLHNPVFYSKLFS